AKRLQDQIIDILRYIDSSQLIQQQIAKFPLVQLPDLLNQITTEVDIQPVILNMPETLNKLSLAISNQVIEMIMRELFTNAKKFHPHNLPTIDITLTPKAADKIILAVRDDGRHLSPEELSKLGIPFYQQEKYFTGEVKGMGLGLAMMTKLVWSCGGHYQLSNRTDSPGLLIEFVLPVLQST
ncbi:MAG: ATP-binding protein, partial [Pseudomonadota bacterium]|nr:ATP-binding protein [Pseudomonadota bacterium]